jgi:hypothetical protein
MVIANVIGDRIDVFIFKSLIPVAIASVIFTIIGVMKGFYFLNKELVLSHMKISSSGLEIYKNSYKKLIQLIT